MKRIALYLGFVLFLALLAQQGFGQSATASLRGVVTDATGAVIPGAEVVITSNDTEQRHTQRSDSNGEF